MNTAVPPSSRIEPLFQCPPDVHNEVYDTDGQPRPHWQKFLQLFRTIPAADFARRNLQADRMLRENGVNYHSPSDGGEGARPWRLDLLPLVTTAAEWGAVETALAQRARLLNLIIADIYGQRRLLESGLLPPEVLFANPEYLRPFCDLQTGDQTPMFLYAAELARRADGSFCV
ncbi:MAG: circularly permuted type 2 ATP-grasp protein, partial [Planctomyces sp.]